MTDQEFTELEKYFSDLCEKQLSVDLSALSPDELKAYWADSEKMKEAGSKIMEYIRDNVPLPNGQKVPILHEHFVSYWLQCYAHAKPEEKAEVFEEFNEKAQKMSPEELKELERQLGEEIATMNRQADELLILVQKMRLENG